MTGVSGSGKSSLIEEVLYRNLRRALGRKPGARDLFRLWFAFASVQEGVAYRDLNATLGNFYEQPKNDNAEMDELLERIASLESELESERGKASSMDEQVALMEKSYELAAKYMGGQNGGQPSAEQRAEPTTVQKGKKNKASGQGRGKESGRDMRTECHHNVTTAGHSVNISRHC